MKISSSSSFILATAIASSGSLSALAAPTDAPGDLGAGSLTSIVDPIVGAAGVDSRQTNNERRGVAARQLDSRDDGLLGNLIDPILETVLGALGIPVKKQADASAAPKVLDASQVSQIQDTVSKAVSGLPISLPLPNAVPSNAHAAFAMNEASTTSSSASGYPTASQYPYSFSSVYGAEAAGPTHPGLPVDLPINLPVGGNPLSPPLPANPPNTPVPPSQGASGPAADNSTTSASVSGTATATATPTNA